MCYIEMTSVLRTVQRTSSGAHLVGVGVKKSLSESEKPKPSMDKENRMADKKKSLKAGNRSAKTVSDKNMGTDEVCTQDASENTDVSLVVVEEESGGMREMLLGHTPNATYWRLLAERLECELDEAREENLRLSLDLGKKTEECATLQQLADDGIYYASIVNQAMAEGDDSGLYEGNDDDQQ
jgi:hypothetical protein